MLLSKNECEPFIKEKCCVSSTTLLKYQTHMCWLTHRFMALC